jgi:hypothetical protein
MQVNPQLGHRLDHRRVDLFCWVRACRTDVHLPRGAEVQKACGHLRTSRILDADEEHLRDFFHDRPFGLAECLQPLTSEAMSQDRNEDVDPGIAEKV